NLMAAFFTASTLSVFARRTAYDTGYMTMFGITMGSKAVGDNRRSVFSKNPEYDTQSPNYKAELVKKSHIHMKKTLEETEWAQALEGMTEHTAKVYLKNFIQTNAGR